MTLRLYQGTRMVGQPVRRGKRRPGDYLAPASCLLASSGRRLVSDFNRLNQNGAPRLNRAAVARTPGISGHIGAPFFQLTANTSNEALVRIDRTDRKSTRLNSSHLVISYAVFCFKKKNSRPRLRALLMPGRRQPAERHGLDGDRPRRRVHAVFFF